MSRIPDEDMDRLLRNSMAKYRNTFSTLAYGPTNREWPCAHPLSERRLDVRNNREWCEKCWHWIAA